MAAAARRAGPASASSASAGSAGTGWRRCWRPARSRPSAICDPSPRCARRGRRGSRPARAVVDSLDEMLGAGPRRRGDRDAERAARRAVDPRRWKPARRCSARSRSAAPPPRRSAVVDAARAADRLLGVDLSYRLTDGMRRDRRARPRGALGRVFAVDLVFHNAYGPDKPWFYDPRPVRRRLRHGSRRPPGRSRAVDARTSPPSRDVDARALSRGGRAARTPARVEDYAVAQLRPAGDAPVRLACSWRLHAGRDAVIEAAFYGTEGGAALRNVGGSFYDFTAERFDGTDAATRSPTRPTHGAGAPPPTGPSSSRARRAFDPQAEQFVRVGRGPRPDLRAMTR